MIEMSCEKNSLNQSESFFPSSSSVRQFVFAASADNAKFSSTDSPAIAVGESAANRFA